MNPFYPSKKEMCPRRAKKEENKEGEKEIEIEIETGGETDSLG